MIRHRTIAAWAVAATLCLTAPTARAGEAVPFRLVTFNAEILTAPKVRAGELEKFRFDYARGEHLERVAHVIETLSPDVLNLVEVTSIEAVDALVKILHEKGHTQYRGYHVESNDPMSGMDVGVITRIPLVEVDGKPIRTVYSQDDDPTWRQAYSFKNWDGEPDSDTTSLSRNSLYFVEVAGRKLGLLGLHLKSNPDDQYSNAKRMAEVELVRRVVRAEVVARGYLPIVLGDLNDYDPDVPDRDDSRSTKTTAVKSVKDFDPTKPGDELVNAASLVERKADRYTSHWDWNENGAHDPQDVYTMIDHVLVAKELMPFAKRAFIAHVVGPDTSDHYPVVVDFEFPAQ
ncbi:MAG: endonuclease/exonuclease/phosphatase family protein [Lacipirellulaceae bacterium]